MSKNEKCPTCGRVHSDFIEGILGLIAGHFDVKPRKNYRDWKKTDDVE